VIWLLLFLALVLAALVWGWFEAGWVRLRSLDVPISGLPPELDGVRLLHLSDLHLGFPSRGTVAVERAVAWAEERRPDLVLITGDLLSRPSGEARLRDLVRRLPSCYAVLGNHDFAVSHDPFSKPSAVEELAPATVLADDVRTVELRGRRVLIAGVDPRSYRAGRAHADRLSDPAAQLRILLCHYPYVVDKLQPGSFHLVLSGHLHSGQLAIPYGAGKIRLSQRRWTYVEGLYDRPGGILHVSPGLGTTFVPFRFFARPEATELVLRTAPAPADEHPK
jgi:uncharacterized protein